MLGSFFCSLAVILKMIDWNPVLSFGKEALFTFDSFVVHNLWPAMALEH